MTAHSPTRGGGRVKETSSSSKGRVRVVSRIRPLAKYEIEKGSKLVVTKVPTLDADAPSQALQVNEGGGGGSSSSSDNKRWFELDAVLDHTCTQQDVYVQSGANTAIVEDLFQGYNCTILAYGQTGAGKTFTMGTAAQPTSTLDVNDGVIPRAVKDLFDTITTKCDSNAHVELSYMEVYNEEIRDLMDPARQSKAQLRIRETLNGEVYVRGLQARTVATPGEVGKLMEEAGSRRVVASTKMNAVSSRSHAICVLKVKGVLEDSTKFQSKLTLVDLAGSERLKKTAAQGNRAQEGININKGLFTLGQCVSALAEQRPKFKRKPPFRDSKLTRLLQDSLGGNSRTIMIACCSPADFNVEETINTLRYAAQARNIKNSATANVVQQISQEEAMKLQRENALLKAQIAELQETIKQLTEDVTPEELNRSMALISNELHRSQVLSTDIGSSPKSKSAGKAAAGAVLSTNLSPAGSTDGGAGGTIPELDIPPPSPPPFGGNNNTASHVSPKKKNNMSLGSHFGRSGGGGGGGSSARNVNHDEVSLQLDEVLPGLKKSAAAARKEPGLKPTYEELEQENLELSARLNIAQGDVRATVTQSAIELPALKVRVMMLEEELNESMLIEQETVKLKEELEEAKADRESALLAANQLSEFMEKQKSEHGFRGDELDKRRLWYFNKRLDEKWVNFVVIMLSSFKEQMRLLGDYFEMVVSVVESPDILTMLGNNQKAKQTSRWGFLGGGRQHDETEEKELRHRLLGEHIKFFNARLLEIEDEINNRSESVDAILDGLVYERAQLEQELNETEFVHDLFSKKGEKLLKHMTELLTGPLFTLPLIPGQE